MANTPVTTVIVDSQPLYRDALHRTLAADERIVVVGTFADGLSALPTIARLAPTLVIADLQIDGGDGVSLLPALAAAREHMLVLVLSAWADASRATSALRAGASGYLSKAASDTEIVDAVLAVARGRTVLGASVQAKIAESIRNGEPEHFELSGRECAVLGLCADGLSREEIGRHLHISPATVKGHLAQVYGKLGVSRQSAAVALAIRKGIV